MRNPMARNNASIMMAVLPLPLVPVIRITGQDRSGLPSRSHRARTRAWDRAT